MSGLSQSGGSANRFPATLAGWRWHLLGLPSGGLKRGRWLRIRRHAADHHWPRWLRVWMARPHAYGFARQAWRWPRRHALGYALAPLFRRTYTHAVVSRGEARKAG